MTTLVIGGDGQLGRALRRRAPAWRYASRAEVDLTGDVDRALARLRPELVVNAAAYTAVDRAEAEPGLAFAVNAEGPRRLAVACAAAGVPLVHVSTDYVFDGTKGAPYTTADPVCPISVYGASKAAGEDAIRAALDQHVIVRTAWLFGPDQPGFVSWVIRGALQGVDLPLVADHTGNPTPVDGLADRLVRAAERLGPDAWGTWHGVGGPATSWLGFGEALLARVGGRCHPVDAASLARPAARPPDGRLAPAWPAGLAELDWRDGLDAVVDAWVLRLTSTPP